MLTKEQKLEEYGPGEWVDEPDRVEFRAHGFVCLVKRGPSGALCGYVGVPPEHPWHGKDSDEIDADVHGGLTYSNHCQGEICHVPEPGEPEHLYWLGFDCAHSGDIRPGDAKYFEERGLGPIGEWFSRYRTISYVRRQTESLAEQAKAALELTP